MTQGHVCYLFHSSSPSVSLLLLLRSLCEAVDLAMSSVTQVPHYAAGRSPGPEPAPFGSPTLGQAHAPVSKPPAITIPPSFQNQKTVFAPQAPESQDSGRASPISTEKGSYQSTSSKRAASPKDINAIHYLDRRKGNWRPPLPETDTISSHSVVYPRSPLSASDPEKQCTPRRTNQSDIEHLVSSANPYSTVTFMRDEAPDEAAILKQHVTKILASHSMYNSHVQTLLTGTRLLDPPLHPLAPPHPSIQHLRPRHNRLPHPPNTPLLLYLPPTSQVPSIYLPHTTPPLPAPPHPLLLHSFGAPSRFTALAGQHPVTYLRFQHRSCGMGCCFLLVLCGYIGRSGWESG